MELKQYIGRKRNEEQTSAGGLSMSPDNFDGMYNKTWDRVYGYIAAGSIAHQNLMQVLSQRQVNGSSAYYLPPEYQIQDSYGNIYQQEGADVLFRPYLDSIPGTGSLNSKERRIFSNKIRDFIEEAGLSSNGISETMRLATGFVAQIVEIQKGVDSVPLPIIMAMPDNGYGSLRPAMLKAVRSIGDVSYSMNHPKISFRLRDPGSGAIRQQQDMGSVEQFLVTMQQAFASTIMRQTVLDEEIPMSQFMFDPDMLGVYGLDPRIKVELEQQRGSRWQVGVNLTRIYSPESWDARNIAWDLQYQFSHDSVGIAEGSIPQSLRFGGSYMTDEEKRYRDSLFSIGELIVTAPHTKVSTPLLVAAESELAAALTDMANAWDRILDTTHSEVLYSVLNSTWFTALSYGIAQRSRIHNSLSLPIR